ncbi:putative F-box family protein [Quillaja saponaria]|uniref:F-box family protein n=1 Tax=Quillaja saponaria TaxID=32244 RepID=A0AAD7Q4S6_QUISA|nr:putative F-box family protein [Quillaja saponaria]
MISIERARTNSYLLTTATTTATKTQSSFSVISVANNEELLIEILLRLPIKSLLKFKSVSKYWLSLISCSHFSYLHKDHNPFPNSASGLFLRRHSPLVNPQFSFVDLNLNPDTCSSASFRSLTFIDNPSGVNILQSCNGLLLCSSFPGANQSKTNYYIYNPTTKQYSLLPPFGSSNGALRTVFAVSLAFDPFKSPYYKVVCVRDSGSSGNHFQFEIYSSDTGLWRVCGSSLSAFSNVQFYGGVYWHGSVHWISTLGNSLYFNIDKEEVQELPMPPIPDFSLKRVFNYFEESRDHLHLIEIYDFQNLEFNVYEIERDYSGWFVKYHVDLGAVPIAFPEMKTTTSSDLHCYRFSILSVVRGQRDENSYLVLSIPGKVVRYNFQDKTFHKLCDIPTGHDGIDDFDGWSSFSVSSSDAYQYTESLSYV